jgi:hypothetical protein
VIALNRKHRSVLCHSNSSFTSRHIKTASKILGLSYKESLETHIWVYELHSQIQKRAGDRCVLIGGINTVIDEYDYYLSLVKKERRMFKRELKERITSRDSLLNLEGTGNSLRLIYLDYILSNMKPSLLKKQII